MNLLKFILPAHNPWFFLLWVLLFSLLLNSNLGLAGEEFPSKPSLRLETGMHYAPIRRIDTDNGQRYLVTGSHDKTARIWNLKSGNLLQTLRVPIGVGDLGKVYSVAISSDGSEVAVSGFTGLSSQTYRLFIFDSQTGAIKKVISKLPNVIVHLTYSPGGKYLVASFGESNGIQVYERPDYELVAEDYDYDDSSYWAAFSTKGDLVTTSYDGFIRLYDKNFTRILKKKVPGGDEPFSAAFSPDDNRIAVGYVDTTRVDVLSGESLELLFSADTSETNGNFGIVSWSKDGRYLYGGGLYFTSGNRPVRRWDDGGKGSYTDIEAGNTTIMGIQPLPDGSIIVGAADPYLALRQKNGKVKWVHRGNIADFRGQRGANAIQLSFTGDEVLFGFNEWGNQPALFSLQSWQLDPEPKEDSQLTRPITEASELKITDWVHKYTPHLNGNPLPLRKYELSRSLAISPDKQSFLLGTSWKLRLFDRAGKQLWEVATPSTAWAVNISGDSKLAVAGFGDGTLRWYRLSDGTELLALFPHKDTKRWVAWTPEGFYQASAGGEDLIGWHLNHGVEETPEFFGASRFRDQFYRPDVVSRVLDTLDVDEALALADKARDRKTTIKELKNILPPTISIISPAAGTKTTSTKLAIFYHTESATGPILDITARVNGRPASVLAHPHNRLKGEKGQYSMTGSITVEVPSKDAEVSLIASNRHGNSEPAIFTTNWAGRKDWYKPNLYVLAVGVSHYDQKHLKLNYAAKDAEDFVETIKSQEGGLYKKVRSKLLVSDTTRKEATQDKILDGLDWIEQETTSRDVAVVFLSGHGANDTDGNYNFLPQDADSTRLRRTAIDNYNIKKYLSNIAGKIILFVDSCRAGNVRLDSITKGNEQADQDKFANELAGADSGVIVFSSSTGKQISQEKQDLRNGVFTDALLEAIKEGKADFIKDQHISIAELEVFLPERVKELTNGEQKPVSAKPRSVEDLKIIRIAKQ